jgi:hypothetical protein
MPHKMRFVGLPGRRNALPGFCPTKFVYEVNRFLKSNQPANGRIILLSIMNFAPGEDLWRLAQEVKL